MLVNGFRGKVGNAVLRRRGNKTYLTSRPKARTTEATEKEKAHRERFRRAAAYAKAKLSDPVAKAEYEYYAEQREMMSAFNAALTDYLKLPTIDALRTELYKGVINDVIIAKVADDFKIVSVKVSIVLPDGTLLESGNATFDIPSLEWKYRATQTNALLVGSKVIAVANDRAGNETTLEKVM